MKPSERDDREIWSPFTGVQGVSRSVKAIGRVPIGLSSLYG